MSEKYTDVYNRIARRAAKNGVSLRELCHRVGVTEIMLQQWKRRTPKSLVTYFKFEQELDKVEKEVGDE